MIDWQAETRAEALRRADGTELEYARRAKARTETVRKTITIEDLPHQLASVQREIKRIRIKLHLSNREPRGGTRRERMEIRDRIETLKVTIKELTEKEEMLQAKISNPGIVAEIDRLYFGMRQDVWMTEGVKRDTSTKEHEWMVKVDEGRIPVSRIELKPGDQHTRKLGVLVVKQMKLEHDFYRGLRARGDEDSKTSDEIDYTVNSLNGVASAAAEGVGFAANLPDGAVESLGDLLEEFINVEKTLFNYEAETVYATRLEVMNEGSERGIRTFAGLVQTMSSRKRPSYKVTSEQALTHMRKLFNAIKQSFRRMAETLHKHGYAGNAFSDASMSFLRAFSALGVALDDYEVI